MEHQILVINPGSTSTKIAVYKATTTPNTLTEVLASTIRHSTAELAPYVRIVEQYKFREDTILGELEKNNYPLSTFTAIIGRGGLVKPIPSGTYQVNDLMLQHLSEGYGGEHASNLGGLLAHSIAQQIPGCQAFIADPVVVDEFHDVARLTGFAEIKRRSIFHALNQKAIAKRYAQDCGTPYDKLNLIVVHMGGGISVGAHQQGRVIDVNDALQGDGPMGPERAGSLPAMPLIRMCFSGQYTQEELIKKTAGKGGMVDLTGTNSFLDICNRMQAESRTGAQTSHEASGPTATQVFNAMAYAVGKEIGAMAAALHGRIDAILFTGGLAHSQLFVDQIANQIGFLAPCHTYPGEDEMYALAANAYAVLTGQESPGKYI